ncbi:MAG: hypothetical protein CGW95_15305, partial [Phenylobacterium zucineum]
NDTLYPAPEVSFADDLTTFSPDCSGLQAQADIVSAFTNLFGLQIATNKLRLVVFHGRPPLAPETITVHVAGWQPVHLSPQYAGVVRILGYHFSLDGSHRYQHKLTKQRIAIACGAMYHSTRSSPAGVALTAMVSCIARASYAGQFSPWSPDDLRALEPPLNALYRRLLCMMPTSATHLLYMPTTYGGAGLPSLADNVTRRKWNIVHRALHMNNTAARATGGLLDRAARLSGYPTRPMAYSRIDHALGRPSWGSLLGTAVPDFAAHLSKGRPLSLLDHSIWPSQSLPLRSGQALLRTLGPLLWGHLTYQTATNRHWIDERTFARLGVDIPYPTDPCPQQPFVNVHSGAFWECRHSPSLPGGIYEITSCRAPRIP